jgi:UDP-N-acetylmuramyl pentapeptide phosphotransferase/UDP-N-acetylglucosamine-1-phosphate transferase
MNERPAVAFALGFALAAAGVVLFRPGSRRWTAPNRRGDPLPVTLGWSLALGVSTTGLVVLDQVAATGVRDSQAGELLGAATVFVAGIVDDGFGGDARGLRDHLRALASGRVTTGVLKLAAAVLASAIVVAWTPRDQIWANVLALVAIAGCTNVWNGLDVVPGRAVKGFLVVAIVLLVIDVRPFLLACAGAALATLWPDLRERGMLGDSGANLLGFVAGAEIVRRLPEIWLIPAATIVVALNLLAETLTFSRTIEAIPPLRWFDRLGRLPEPGSRPNRRSGRRQLLE